MKEKSKPTNHPTDLEIIQLSRPALLAIKQRCEMNLTTCKIAGITPPTNLRWRAFVIQSSLNAIDGM